MKLVRYVTFFGVFCTGVLWGWFTKQTAPRAEAFPAHATSLATPAPESSSPAEKDFWPGAFSDRWRHALGQGNPFKRAREFAAIANGLSEAEIREALAVCPDLHFTESAAILEELMVRWGEINPEAAVEYALKLPATAGPALQAAIKGWAGMDPKSAEGWAAKYQGPFGEQVWRAVAGAVAGDDPEHALDLVQKSKAPMDGSLLDAIFSRWVENSPLTAAAHAAQLPEGIQRKQSLEAVAEKWAQIDPVAALDWLQTLKDQGYAPSQGVTYPAQPDALTRVMQVWGNREPDAAARWLESVSDEQKRHGLAHELVNARADEDPAAAADLATKLFPAGESRNEVLKEVARRWEDAGSEIPWIQGQSDPGLKRAMMDGILTSPFFRDVKPELIGPLFDLRNVYEDENKMAVTGFIVSAWSKTDLPAAAAWAEQAPPDAAIYSGIEGTWLTKDPAAATAWMDRQPDGPAKQQFLSSVGYLNVDAQIAIRWIGQITDDDAREKTCQTFAGAWLDRDFVAARAWLDSTDLAPEVKQELLQSHAH